MHVAVVDDQESALAGFSQILRRIADVEPICFKKASDALRKALGLPPETESPATGIAKPPGAAVAH